MQADFLYTPAKLGLYCHCASLLLTTSGTLMAVWYGYPQVEYKNAGLVLTQRIAGEWRKAQHIFPQASYSHGNPVLFCDPFGVIRLLFVRIEGAYWDDARIYHCASNDEGRSWSTPTLLWPKKGFMIRHAPIALADNRLLLPVYDETNMTSVLFISAPPYEKWHPYYHFEGVKMIQPDIAQTDTDTLLIFFRPTREPQFIWRSLSMDAGKTWISPVRTSLPNPLSGIAAFQYADHTALVYNHTDLHHRFPLSLNISQDYGVTWRVPWHIDRIAHEVSYPSFIAEPGKGAHGVYTYNRRMIKYVFIPEDELLVEKHENHH